MAWLARITSVVQALDKTNDSITVTVLFHDDTDAREYTKKYIFYMDELVGITLPDFKAIIDADRDKLVKLDAVRDVLSAKIGIDI